MKALVFSRFGEPDVLEFLEVPDPVPGPGQCLVNVLRQGAAAGALSVPLKVSKILTDYH